MLLGCKIFKVILNLYELLLMFFLILRGFINFYGFLIKKDFMGDGNKYFLKFIESYNLSFFYFEV